MVDLERAKYCPYCGELLPKIQEKSSLEDQPFETCKSCGQVFIALTTRDVFSVLDRLKMLVDQVLPSESTRRCN